jgi:sugar lactone lactonase YvrE
MSAELEEIQPAHDDIPGVSAVVYPHPDHEGRPWSQWGQGIIASDGRFFSAIGDHQGVDGNAYVYVLDPTTGSLTLVSDVLSHVDHSQGEFGFGKIHGQMVADACGAIYFSTYWGSRRGLVFTDSYQGDILFRIDPVAETIEPMNVILPEHGVASMASAPEQGLLYAEAADPFGEKVGSFVAIDPATGEVVFEDPSDEHGGYRNVAVADDGRAYITWNDTGLAVFDPATEELSVTDAVMPASVLRASTVPDGEGTIYAVTRDPAVFFTISSDGAVAEMGPARGYTTSMALSPDGSFFYYVPDAHGSSWEQGAPLIAVDTQTGEEEVIVELNPIIEPALGLRLGGTYNVVVDPSGERVYIGFNAGDPASRDTFGSVVLVVVDLP